MPFRCLKEPRDEEPSVSLEAVDHDRLLQELAPLVRETYSCWKEGWVGFTWQNYTYDHVQRVRALAHTIGATEGVDLEVLDLAALLHDVTKGYDGEVITDTDGKRILDDRGLWHNEERSPTSQNAITRMYDHLRLAGQLHNESGATLARKLLVERGLPSALCERVAEVIRSHLRPGDGAPPEGHVLYDADTIDANCGLPAFLRNIHIHLHFREVRAGPAEEPLDSLLGNHPLDYLDTYVQEQLPSWASGKLRDFIPRLKTETGRQMGQARLDRLNATFRQMAKELDSFEVNSITGRLAVVLYFMRHRENPMLSEQLTFLEERWLHLNGATPAARSLVMAIRREMDGVE
jgi:putative nucleotidyltransferase with HDIG domain